MQPLRYDAKRRSPIQWLQTSFDVLEAVPDFFFSAGAAISPVAANRTTSYPGQLSTGTPLQ
ncbi:hypothetical protein [Bradyrhizobium lablabi]|uniref:hypothetical protein n=1 Tax=Bradyrhizobium lablabi TaxID=722472 RepID=UPI0012ABA7C4|nr:hypothetical protein [Bradyrhizobium lablabi]